MNAGEQRKVKKSKVHNIIAVRAAHREKVSMSDISLVSY